jgi:glycosyltransferase involved in cell wall biosynthesis
MKILHIISSGGMYGAEAVILNLSRALNQGPHRSVIGVFSNTSKPNLQLHEAALEQGIESFLIPCSGQLDRTTLTSIRGLVATTKADIIHAHGYKADIYAYFALRGQPLPLVSTCHTWYDNDLLVSLYGMADRRVLQSYAAVVAVSDEVKQRLLKAGVKPDRIHLVRNGIDLRPFDNAHPSLRNKATPDSPYLVGLIGRLANEKGVDIFLRAAARVLTKLPATKFVIIGEGPDRDKLEALSAELNLQNSVKFLGRRDDMPSVYASLDLMVSSSRQEGLPIAILEGMASRLPLIATAVGDVPTVIIDGQTGILVPSEDVETLASAIIKLLQDQPQRNRLATAARHHIEQEYSAQRMMADYLHVYQKASSRPHSSHSGDTSPFGEIK